MATITLSANTNYSALTVANDDTIDCAGFVLTLDEQPTETGIQVTSPGTAGTVVFSGGWNLSTWDFFAGTVIIIATLPEDATIKSVTGGTVSGARGITTNNGTVTTATGGSVANTHGISINNGTVTTANGSAVSFGVVTNSGTVTTANGGTAVNMHGVATNNGDVNTANGGTAGSAHGVNANNGTVTTANGGTEGNANGVNTNNGTVTTANGSATDASDGVFTNNSVVITANGGGVANAWGVATNNAYVLRLNDNVSRGVETFEASLAFVEGPFIDGEIIGSRLETIYTLGAMHVNAETPVGVDIIVLSEGSGGGAAFQLVGSGGLVY